MNRRRITLFSLASFRLCVDGLPEQPNCFGSLALLNISVKCGIYIHMSSVQEMMLVFCRSMRGNVLYHVKIVQSQAESELCNSFKLAYINEKNI